MNFIPLFALLVLFFSGCSYTLKPRQSIPNSQPLYASIVETANGHALEHISNKPLDIDLATLKPISDDVVMRLCKKNENLKCMDTILDVLDSKYERETFVNKYNDLVKQNQEHVKRLNDLYETMLKTYSADKNTIALEYRINDKSALYSAEALFLERYIYIRENNLSYPESSDHSKEIDTLFPVNTLEYIERLYEYTNRFEQEISREESAYKQTLAFKSSFYTLNVEDKVHSGEYTLSVDNTMRIERRINSNKRIIVTIEGKDFSHIFPNEIKNHNKDLTLKIVGNEMIVTNKTDSTLLLEELDIDYNEATSKALFGNAFSFAKIEPKNVVSIPIKSLLHELEKGMEFKNVSKQNAQSRYIPLEFSLKYSLVQKNSDSKNSKQLDYKKAFQLWGLVHH